MNKIILLAIAFLMGFGQAYSQEPAKIKAAQSMSTPRAYHEGIFIPVDGSYLICGGKNGDTILDSCEFFILSSMSWTQGPKMKVARKNPPLANLFLLSKQGSEKGSILIAGGEDITQKPIVKVDFYDIQTRSVDDFNPLPVAHSGGILFFNPTEEPLILAVLIGPGTAITKLVIENQDIKWVTPPVSLNYPREGHRFASMPGYRAIIVGGGSKTIEIYNYKDDTITTSKDLPSDIKGHQIINLNDSRILIAGGVDENNNFIEDTFLYNPITDELVKAGKINVPRKDFRLTLLHNGKVLASGGVDKNGTLVSRLEIFDPANGQWTETLNLITPRANHTAELIGAEGVLICGGNTGEKSPSLKTCEIYTPEKICTPNTLSCDGNWIVKCNSFGDGTNRTNECAGGCQDGQCIGGCKEGERRCRDIGVKIIVEICNATGGWELLQQCEESCKNGYCDGEIPPIDAGIKDAGKDTGQIDVNLADTGIEDNQNYAEDAISMDSIEMDINNIQDNAFTDSGSSNGESSGCGCTLIQ